jgi:hypothetical protein
MAIKLSVEERRKVSALIEVYQVCQSKECTKVLSAEQNPI